jgi:serine/threonine-protein kinase SRPK3
MHRCCGVINTGPHALASPSALTNKPLPSAVLKNAAICVDGVKSMIQVELSVPASKGHCNKTPRSESVFITGLPPSSFSCCPTLDKWAFGMSKINGEEASSEKGGLSTPKRPESADLAVEVGHMIYLTRC